MKSPISLVPAAAPHLALAHFEARLTFEADCWDTHAAMSADQMDFVLIDVRSPSMYADSHIPGAINLPHGKMIKRRMDEWPADTLFAVPHARGTGAASAALEAVIDKAKAIGAGRINWLVLPDNERAKKFYKKHGGKHDTDWHHWHIPI